MNLLKKKISNLFSCLLAFALILSMFADTAMTGTKASAAENNKKSSDEVVSLKEVYKDHFMIGSVVNPPDLTNTAKYEFMKFHFNALTPENATKPDSLWRNANDEPNFTAADNMMEQVNADGFYTIGHALAWHNQSTGWPPSGLTYEEARDSLERYISTVAGHFHEKDSFDAWDVVNEAFRDNPENPTDWRNALRSGLNPVERPSRWYEAYANGGNGWDYVYDSFLFAREAAPDAVLYYNDFNDEELSSKAIAIASMVKELNERYAKEHPEANGRLLIEGIGIQGHYNTRLNVDNLEEVLKIYSETGAKISITELDVQLNGSSAAVPPTEAQLEDQATVYAELFSLYKKYSDVIERVTFWGMQDNNSWRSSGYPLPFDANRAPKEAYWAIIDPEAYLGQEEAAPEITSFNFEGETFNAAGQTEFDVNVPDDVTSIDFSAANVNHGYSAEEVEVSVALSPENGAVNAGEPATATVKIAWKDSPDTSNTYKVHFGHMTGEWLKDQNYPDTGYRSSVNIRFSDGETAPKLFQEFINTETGKLELFNSEEFEPLPKHASGTLTIATDSKLDNAYLETLTLKKSVWNQKWEPILPTRVTDLSKPEDYYKLATTIESGTTYIVVPVNSGAALTNRNVASVDPAGTRGLAGTPLTIEDDIIVGPELLQDNMRFIFNEQTSPDPGPYTAENGYTGYTMLSLVHGGLVAPSILYRDPGSDATSALRSDATIADSALDRAVWFNTGIDPETGETTIFSHTGSDDLTYVLSGNESGFITQKVDSLDDPAYRVKLYEYVSEFNYEDNTSVGTEISFSPVERIVAGRDAEVPVTADVPDGSKAELKKDGVTAASATFENGQAEITVSGSDIDADANYAVVVYNGTELLGAKILPTVTVADASAAATVEKLKGNKNELTIKITETYSDGTSEVAFTETISITNNAANTYEVGPYKVYVNTKGNKVRECYIVGD